MAATPETAVTNRGHKNTCHFGIRVYIYSLGFSITYLKNHYTDNVIMKINPTCHRVLISSKVLCMRSWGSTLKPANTLFIQY